MIPIAFWIITTLGNAASGEVRKDAKSEGWIGLSTTFYMILPIIGLAVLWGQRSFFSKILLQLDRSCVSVFCPSLSRREKLLKWAGSRLPSTWSSQTKTLSSGIPELWKDGSLLCTLINSVVPGACPNPHRHWRKPPLHAQALAYKYLGLTPIFTEADFSREFTINQERSFIHYLQGLQQAINKWPTKDVTNRKYSSQYVARGMGLYAGEQHRKTVFYVYTNSTTKKRTDVLMYIRGPYGTQGKATIPPFHNLKTIPVVNVLQDQLQASKILPFKNSEQKSFLKTISLDFTSLISNACDADDNDIPIHVEMQIDRAKVTYIPNDLGIYEINLISDGEIITGSPFLVRVNENALGEKECLETETNDVIDKITFTRRKVLSKVIDCITEKIYIDDERISKLSNEDSENDVTITAITQKDDEIVKTEINCSLEDFSSKTEEIQDVLQLSKMTEELTTEPEIIPEENLIVTPQHKILNNLGEVKEEIVNFLQQHDVEEEAHYSNEIKIPAVSKFDFGVVETTKFFKNFVNSNKQKGLKPETNQKITSKICFEIAQAKNSTFDSQDSTSPICPSYIVPEVEKSNFQKLPLSEKRKLFGQQNSFMSSTVSSENGYECPSKEDFRELDGAPLSLSSTVSLPNMSMNFESHFRQKRDFWERLSSRSSSIVSLTNSEQDQPLKKYISREKTLARSTNDILSLQSETDVYSNSRYTSLESVLDNSFMSIKERKKLLVKSFEGKAKKPPKKLQTEFRNSFKEDNCSNQIPNRTVKKKNISSSICEKIKKFDIKIETKPEVISVNKIKTPEKGGTNERKSVKFPTDTDKSQFKRGIKFFTKLEGNIENTKKETDVKRKHSFDSQTRSKKETKKGGSLNLPNICEKFAIRNLYEDILGSRGSFKGTPNRKGVANSLGSYFRARENYDEDDENIKYNLFFNKSKAKKRRSVRTIFDVNY